MRKTILFLSLVCWVQMFLLNYVNAEGRGSIAGLPYGSAAKNGSFFLYAYAEPGEKIDWLIEKTRADGGSDGDWTVQVYSPLGLVGSICTVGNTVGDLCTNPKITVGATEGGIWTLHVIPLSNESNNCVSFDLSVNDAADAPILGRVYATKINGNDKSSPVEPDFTLYFLTTDGYKYSAIYRGLTGLNYTIIGDNLGVRTAGSSCVSAYHSFYYTSSSTNRGPDSSSCGNRSKIFFNSFDAALPASAPRFNIGSTGQTIEPLVFSPATPSLSTPVFTRNGNCTQAGNISFSTTNYSGPGFINYDANNDGDYSDAADRADTLNFLSGANSIVFDGLDGLGNPIPAVQIINIRVATNKIGEAHFVMSDIEILRDGIEVTRLNGPGSPSKTLYWDDTFLPSADNCSVTSQVDGTAGIISTGGVHGWNSCGGGSATSGGTNANNGIDGSWGDNRLIDNWVYYIPAAATQTITAPAASLFDFGDLTATWPVAKASSTGTDTNGDCVIDNNDIPNTQSVWMGNSLDFETSQHYSLDASLDAFDDGLIFPPSALTRGSFYNFSVRINSNSSAKTVYYAIWYDWNNNGDFSDDVDCAGSPAFYSGSGVTPSSAGGGITTLPISMCVPTDALEPGGVSTNDYKVRVLVSDAPIIFTMYDASIANGEVEDYRLPLVILPVTFGNFTLIEKNCTISINFETLSEYHNNSFNVERSKDGMNWISISKLSSTSGGTGPGIYQFIDDKATLGQNYYRIKQLDANGAYGYSRSIAISKSCNGKMNMAIYPNPVKNKLIIALSEKTEKAQIKIINVLGQTIIPLIQNNGNMLIADVEKLSPGIYFVYVMQDGKITGQSKFLKQE